MSLLLALGMALTLTVPVMAQELSPEPTAALTQDVAPDQSPESSGEESTVPPAEQSPDAAPAASENAAPSQEEEFSSPVPEGSEDPAQEGDAGDPAAPAHAEDAVPDSLSLKTLETAQLTVDGALSYQSSDEAVVTVDESGLVTAQHVGSAALLITTQEGEVLTCLVTVSATTTSSKESLSVGKSTTLKLEDGRVLERAQSSDEEVATVDEDGKVTAKESGVAEITLTDTLGDLHICTLKVKGVLSDKELSVSEEETAQVRLQGSDIVEAKSSDEDVVTVDEDGTITGVQEGTAVVTLTDESGSPSKCKITVDPNYLARTAKNAKRIYRKIETLGCRHVSGVHTYEQMCKRRHCSCTTGASLALQAAGVLPHGKTVTHTKSGSERRKLKDPDKAIAKRKNLIKGTYTLYKANCRYSKLPKKYKQAGMVYIQDSNICVSAGDGYIYSCNQSSRQYRHGRYFRTKNKSGYTHHHKILYVIAPNS